MNFPDDERLGGVAADSAIDAQPHNPSLPKGSSHGPQARLGDAKAQVALDLAASLRRAGEEDPEGLKSPELPLTGDADVEPALNPFGPKHNAADLKVFNDWVAHPVHILLMTALFEERRALKFHFQEIINASLDHLNKTAEPGVVYTMVRQTSNFVDTKHALERWAFIRSKNTVPDPEPLIIGITTLRQMGNVHAALHTQRMLMVHKPRLIFLIGICGSAAPKSLALGDVLIADEVHWVNAHNLVTQDVEKPDAKLAEWFIWARKQHDTDSFWLELLRAYFEDRSTHLPSNTQPDPAKVTKEKIVFGPLVSTNHVVDHAGIRDCHKKEAKALGLEMEAAGMLEAIAGYNDGYTRPPRTFGFTFKGVSDLAAEKQDNNWREIAGRNAAFCALSFILLNLSLIEQGIIGMDESERQPRSTLPSRP